MAYNNSNTRSHRSLDHECPLDWSMLKTLNSLPELMLKDREVLANKIDALAEKSDMKDEENERSIEAVVEQMNEHRSNNNQRFDKVEHDIHDIKSKVTELKQTTYKTGTSLSNLNRILKWVLGVFTSLLLLILGILARAWILALL